MCTLTNIARVCKDFFNIRSFLALILMAVCGFSAGFISDGWIVYYVIPIINPVNVIYLHLCMGGRLRNWTEFNSQLQKVKIKLLPKEKFVPFSFCFSNGKWNAQCFLKKQFYFLSLDIYKKINLISMYIKQIQWLFLFYVISDFSVKH